jgi:hypothetical protein
VSVDVPVLEVFDLADRLRSVAGLALEASARLTAPGAAGALTAPLDGFAEAFRLAAGALAVEIDVLGRTTDAVARSWLAMDADLLPRRGQVLAR